MKPIKRFCAVSSHPNWREWRAVYEYSGHGYASAKCVRTECLICGEAIGEDDRRTIQGVAPDSFLIREAIGLPVFGKRAESQARWRDAINAFLKRRRVKFKHYNKPGQPMRIAA